MVSALELLSGLGTLVGTGKGEAELGKIGSRQMGQRAEFPKREDSSALMRQLI